MSSDRKIIVHPAHGTADRSIAVIGGCGHVGLPLGIVLASRGARVTLIDKSEDRMAQVASGRMPFLERGAEELLSEVLAAGNLQVTSSLDAVPQQDAVIVTVGTPVDEFLNPDVQYFDRTMDDLFAHLRDGQLLILRSTVFPGLTERLGLRAAERNLAIDIAYCPERIAQGYAVEELVRLPQLVGGLTPEATARARRLYESLGARVIELQPVEAELSKLFANAYRYINFAISNQFYCIAEKFGADFHRVHAAVTAEYPRMAAFARAGFAGGPCLLKDTMQLAAFNHNAFVLGQAAMMVNEGLPTMLVERARTRHDLRNMTAAILGMAFKGNNDDIRDSLSFKLRKLLMLDCRRVLCTDVYIHDPSFVPLDTAIREADIIFLGACHDEYRDLEIDKPVIDVFGFLRSSRNESIGDGSGGVHRRLPGRRVA
jgi:UDP-N-acetyl-D-mannosaminuronic acid dehydrogenase